MGLNAVWLPNGVQDRVNRLALVNKRRVAEVLRALIQRGLDADGELVFKPLEKGVS